MAGLGTHIEYPFFFPLDKYYNFIYNEKKDQTCVNT